MEHIARIEVTLSGEAAELYEILSGSVGDSATPSQVNRAVMETGIVHHMIMLLSVGAVPAEREGHARAAIDEISKGTIMKDLFAQARGYWDGQSGSGLITPES